MSLNISGDSSNNVLYGGDAFDVLEGHGGNDSLFGRAGADTLLGGAGNDNLHAGDAGDYSDAEGFVYRLYLATLDREPDSAGLSSWVSLFQDSGLSQTQIASGFVNSPEFQSTYGLLSDSEFVELLYNNVLGRSSDPTGLNSWLDAMTGGLSRADVVLGFSNSPEFIANTEFQSLQYFTGLIEGNLGAVFRAYGAILDRAPDVAGFEGWLDLLDGNSLTLQQVIDGFTGSQEFITTYGALSDTAFVSLLYNNVLDRNPDANGLQQWLENIANGMSRAEIVLGFSQSPEYISGTDLALTNFIRDNFSEQADTLIGGEGDDRLFGGRGGDTFSFDVSHPGHDTVFGFDQFDNVELTGFGYLTVDDFSAHLVQNGTDVEFSDQGVSITFSNTSLTRVQNAWTPPLAPVGTDQDDVLVGNDSDNVIEGGDGGDLIVGAGGDDIVIGGNGNDILNGGAGNDVLTGGNGYDTFVLNPNDPGTSTITDLSRDDIIDLTSFGFETANQAMEYMQLNGGDVIFSFEGVTAIFQNVSLQDVFTVINLPEIINGDVGDNDLIGTDRDSTIIGSGGHDLLVGNGGNDTLNGGDGRDTIIGGAGDDVMTGGFGTDTFVFDVQDPGSDVVEDLDSGDTIQLVGFGYLSIDEASAHIRQEGENVIFNDMGVVITFNATTVSAVVSALDLPNVVNGDAGDNQLDGSERFDIVNGFDGDDVLRGFGDDDQLNGGAGNDSLFGGQGVDELRGQDGDDTLFIDLLDIFDGGDGIDTIILENPNSGPFTIDLGARNAEIVFASNFDDTLDATNSLASVEVNGLSGNDQLLGGMFDDILNGDDGDDSLYGGDGQDAVFGGDGSDTLHGDGGFDILNGGDGADSLNGGADGDVLVGGFGADVLTGGEGVDVFGFNAGDSLIGSEDTITDFAIGERLAFDDHSFIDQSEFSGSGNFEIRSTSDGNTTFIELDRDGDGFADEAIILDGDFDFVSDGRELTAISLGLSMEADWIL